MATLVYASSSRDQFISTYSSEPVLTFGAARLWYATSDEPVLETKILPQLSKILHQEVTDTGGVGELVARIVLLMAMDATGFLLSGIPKDRIYAGEFRSVWDFLRVLHGEAPDVMNPENHDECDTAEDVLKKMELEWKDWKIGFSHFVQLSEEPDEDCLWSMLTRRAAAAFPRNFRGVDLFIPIFKPGPPPKVSMILVQVKNWKSGDSAFPETATILMRPNKVFTQKNEFKKLRRSEVARVYISLRGNDNPKRFYLLDPPDRMSKRKKGHQTAEQQNAQAKREAEREKATYVLCLDTLAGWSSMGDQGHDVQLLSDGVATLLKALVDPWSDPMDFVGTDLKLLSDVSDVERRLRKKNASRPLIHSLVVEKWDSVVESLPTEPLLRPTRNSHTAVDSSLRNTRPRKARRP